ncbi:MAG: fibronectin type III domain-containing protein, partial [Roseiflexaceae bacterium]
MPAPLSTPHAARVPSTRRLSSLFSLLIICGLLTGSLPPPRADATPSQTPRGVRADSARGRPARAVRTATAAPASAQMTVFLPLIRSNSAPTPAPTPTATPAPSPTGTPAPTATPTSTPIGPAGDTQPPAVPANLRLDAKTSASISLVWDATTDNVAVAGYEILIGTAVAAATADTLAMVGGLTPDTSYVFAVRAKDAAGNRSAASAPLSVRTRRVDGLPADPADIAPPVEQTTASDFAANIEFLYSGPDAIQTGVAPQAIDARRAAVLRGLVLTRDGTPLPGVTITTLGHPEYGQTRSRADGVFDLVINGGGLLTVNYARDGYLPIQRQIDAPWRDFAWLPDVALIPLDTALTAVTLDGAGPPQVARGGVVTDTDGVRQAKLLFPANLTATLVLSDNTSVPLTTLHIRATEYTIGPNGPKTMPGPLPANSAYTYAAEFSADEALAVGAKTIRFSQPVINYIENFLGFPVGTSVPTGYYDRDRAVWVPSNNGRVIAIVSLTGALADLDITGDGGADDTAALGVTEAERRQLAELYQVGQELWRVPIPHFTAWDHNWPFGPPWDAIGPNGGPPWGDSPLDDPCKLSGSIVECQNQTLGEAIAVAGTPFSLHYQSDRVAGRTAAKALRIPVSRGQLPASLDHIELQITVAGQRIAQSLPAVAVQAGSVAANGGPTALNSEVAGNQIYDFTWNGRDAYGRQLQGAQPIGVQIGYVYPLAYRLPLPTAQSFGGAGTTSILSLNRAGAQATLAQSYRSLIGPLDVRQQGLGGWTLDVHHTYDPHSGTLYQGDGGRRGAQQFDATTTIAGYCLPDSTFSGGYYGDGGLAVDASLNRPSGIAFGPDGSLYIADAINQRVRRVDLDGVITTVAGSDEAGFGGDGGPATAAKLNYPSDVAVGPDGSLYIADTLNHRIRRVAPDGIIRTFAGGNSFVDGDGGPATSAWLIEPSGIALGSDGSLYIADISQGVIRRVAPNGIITTFAGNTSQSSSGDGGLAHQAGIGRPAGVAVGPDGSVYIADNYNNRVRRVAPDGIITTVAGSSRQLLGDGGPAVDAGLDRPSRVAIGRDGILYIADYGHNRVRMVLPDDVITTLAGNGRLLPIGENSPPAAASLDRPEGIALRPDGSLYIADTRHHCIRRAGPPADRSSLSGHRIPSQDGAELYEFDQAGRHLRTLDAFTDATIYTFIYDAGGRLSQIADRDGRVTLIQRDDGGRPLAIVGPDGQRTDLVVDAIGHLVNMTNPVGETTSLAYTAEGLLTRLIDARGGVHSFTYDDQGRLVRDSNPAGGFTTLARSDDDSKGYTVTMANALGDATTMRIEMLPGGAQRRVNTASNGAVTTTFTKPDGTRVITDTRGNVTTSLEAPDPRWGMQAPFVKSLTIKTTDGQVFYRLAASRTARLSTPADPFSLRSQTDTITINGRSTTTVFDAASRTYTTTDPAGKRTVVTFDAQAHLVREETSNLAPKLYAYDPQGRLVGLTEGEGADARTTTLAYDAQGYLTSTADAQGGTTSYTYDLAGRMLSRTLPTEHAFTFTYDTAGNCTSSTDPQGLQTSYEYDLQNRLIAMTLDPDGRAVRSEYAYDLAGNLIARVEDAGSGRLNVTTRYDYAPIGSAGGYALSRVIDPLGHATRYTYTPSGEVSSITDPLSRTTVL